MRRTSIITAAALVGGLLLGVIAAPSLVATTASAQSAPAQTQAAGPMDTLRTLFLDKLAAALNIDRTALDGAITSATMATADQAVTDGTLTQAQADALKARAAAGDLGALWGGGRGGPGGGAKVAGVREAIADAAASTLGITTDELKTQLQSGQTLAQLAAAHTTTEQAVIDAGLAAAKTKLDAAVAASTITQAQADAEYAELQARGANLLMGGGRGGHGERGARPAQDAAPSASPSASTTSST